MIRSTIDKIKECILKALCHSKDEDAKELESNTSEVIIFTSDDDVPLPAPNNTEISAQGEKSDNSVETSSAGFNVEECKHIEFNNLEPMKPLGTMSQKEIENIGQETCEQETQKGASDKPVNESKLVSLTVDSIKYYDKLRHQMPTDDLRNILDDVCCNLIDNLILSGCTPINEEPGSFDLSRHRVEPFQIVDEGTPYSKVERKGIVYKNEVKLLAIVKL